VRENRGAVPGPIAAWRGGNGPIFRAWTTLKEACKDLTCRECLLGHQRGESGKFQAPAGEQRGGGFPKGGRGNPDWRAFLRFGGCTDGRGAKSSLLEGVAENHRGSRQRRDSNEEASPQGRKESRGRENSSSSTRVKGTISEELLGRLPCRRTKGLLFLPSK